MERIEGLRELAEANFGNLSEKEIEKIVRELLKKYQDKPKNRDIAKKFKQELRKELERWDPKRVLFAIDK